MLRDNGDSTVDSRRGKKQRERGDTEERRVYLLPKRQCISSASERGETFTAPKQPLIKARTTFVAGFRPVGFPISNVGSLSLSLSLEKPRCELPRQNPLKNPVHEKKENKNN